MLQKSMFADIVPDKPLRKLATKKPKAATQQMFSDTAFFQPAKKTVMYPDFTGKMALEREDPRSAEQKVKDLAADAQAATTPLALAEPATETTKAIALLSTLPEYGLQSVSTFNKQHMTISNASNGHQAIIIRYPAQRYSRNVQTANGSNIEYSMCSRDEMEAFIKSWDGHINITYTPDSQ